MMGLSVGGMHREYITTRKAMADIVDILEANPSVRVTPIPIRATIMRTSTKRLLPMDV